MGDRSKIELCDRTWNPVVGCSVISPGCTNCYAMKQAARVEAMNFGRHAPRAPSRDQIPPSIYDGLTRDSKAGPVWTGEVRLAPEETLPAPLRWKKPRSIFVNSMGDIFHEGVLDEWIDRVFAVMALAPQHTFLVLTKRAKRMREYMTTRWGGHVEPRPQMPIIEAARRIRPDPLFNMTNWPLPNVHLGVSCEDQPRADERIPDLLATPAAGRFVSAEPLLGATDYSGWLPGSYECASECGWRSGRAPPREVCHSCGATSESFGEFCECGSQDFGDVCPNCESSAVKDHPDTACLDGIIVGGESGPGARPMHPDWPRAIRDQCAAARVPFFFKQHGEWVEVGSTFTPNSAPGDLWIRNDGWTGERPPRVWKPAEMRVVRRVGAKRAGRLLGGREHNDLPWSVAR